MLTRENLILRAAVLNDIHAAARLIQDALGAVHGDIAGDMLHHVEAKWSLMSHEERARALTAYFIAEALRTAREAKGWIDGSVELYETN